MSEGMSRRGWFSVAGGLLAAFGLVPLAKAQVPPPSPPVPPPAPPPGRALSGSGSCYVPGSPCTYTYDASSRLTSADEPGTTMTYFTYIGGHGQA